MTRIYLVGTRSPMVSEFEETLLRCGTDITGLVSVSGRSRVLHPEKLITLAELDDSAAGAGFYAVAFSPKRRQELAELGLGAGLVPAPGLVDPTAAVASSARVGGGSYINAMVAGKNGPQTSQFRIYDVSARALRTARVTITASKSFRMDFFMV